MGKKINFNLFKRKVVINMTNRSFYSLIVFGVLILLCAGVFVVNAYGTNEPAVFGHSAGEIEGCGGSSLWTQNGFDIFYDAGDIVVGEGGFQIGTALTQSQFNDIDNTPGPWLSHFDNLDPDFDGGVGLRIGNKPNAYFTVAKAKNTYAPVMASDYLAVASDNTAIFRIGNIVTQSEFNDIDNTPGPWLQYFDNVDSSFDGSAGLRIGNKANAYFTIAKAKNTYAPVMASDFVTASDQRYKEDIKTIDGAIDRLNNIRGVDFKFKENNKQSMGVIAQEIEKDFPSLVLENEYGYKMVNYDGFIGVLIEAVKTQQKQINNLEKEIEELKRLL